MSIYQFTKEKLLSHGVGSLEHDNLIFSDKNLFRLFVEMERGRRSQDFDYVYQSVEQISKYLKKIDKLSLLLYAYRYLAFFDDTRVKWDVSERDGGRSTRIWFSREMTREEVAIISWAQMMLSKVESYSYRAKNDA